MTSELSGIASLTEGDRESDGMIIINCMALVNRQ